MPFKELDRIGACLPYDVAGDPYAEHAGTGQPKAAVPTRANRDLGFLALAFQGAFQGLIQGGLGLFVFLLADAALFVFDLEVKEFVL